MSTIISSISSKFTDNIFSKIDTKNQGYLEKTDISDALSSSSSDSSNLDELFDSIDTDSDGKITKSEMTKSIENVLSQLNNSRTRETSNRPPPPDGMPPQDEDSGGVTKEQAKEMASNTDDTKLASLMTKVSENFEAADTNKDGKVSFQEAKAYEESTQKTSAKGTSTSESDMSSKLEKLIKAYGFEATSANGVSTSA